MPTLLGKTGKPNRPTSTPADTRAKKYKPLYKQSKHTTMHTWGTILEENRPRTKRQQENKENANKKKQKRSNC